MELQEAAPDGGVIEANEALAEPVLPAAWIGSPDDYESEQRYGGWVDVSREARTVMLAIRNIIDRAPPDLGRRWEVCATRGLGGWMPAENEGLPMVVRVARGVLAFGEHYGGLASALGADSPALDYERYEVSYLGSWASPRAFVEQVFRESWQDELDRLPRSIRPYIVINYRAMEREAKRELTFVDHRDGVWIYDPRVW